MPSVAIHCKASISDGMGHIYRQVCLANELRKQDWEISFYIPEFKPAVDLLSQHGFTPTLIDPETFIPENSNGHFDLVILDRQDTTESLVCSMKKIAPRIASFEDLGSGRDHVDVLIDCNLAPSESYNQQPREFNATLQSLLITMGATDPQGLTLPLTQALLKEKPQLKLTILIGHNTFNASELQKLASQFKTLSLPGPVTNMAQFLWEHDAVVCAGGVTLHEAIAVGTPALVINQVEHQQTKARFVEKSGAVVNLGLGHDYDVKKFKKALKWRKPELESMSLKGKNLIDGRGIFRVIEALTLVTQK